MINNISFVMPVYNGADTIEETIHSIFNTNFLNGDELIIVNDCSLDNTSIVLNKLKNKYNEIIIINNKENKGCPASRNIGISNAKNNLIFNIDSDNVLEKNSVNLLKESLLKNNYDIVAFQKYYFFKKNIKDVTHKWVCREGDFKLEDIFSGVYNPAPGGNFLYKKDFWKKVGGYWEYGKGLHEAWGFSLKLLVNNAKFFVVPKTYYYHRYSHESLYVRENKKKGEAELVTNLFIKPALKFLNNNSLNYVKNNKDWFSKLNKNPLMLKNRNLGKNGKFVYSNKIKNILYFFKII